jgi:secreted Zn-dependent insulinase-like peptidase
VPYHHVRAHDILSAPPVQSLRNEANDQVYTQALRELRLVMRSKRFTTTELMTALESITGDDVIAFIDPLFSGWSARLLASGNIASTDAASLAAVVRSSLPSSPAADTDAFPQLARATIVPDRTHYVYQVRPLWMTNSRTGAFVVNVSLTPLLLRPCFRRAG